MPKSLKSLRDSDRNPLEKSRICTIYVSWFITNPECDDPSFMTIFSDPNVGVSQRLHTALSSMQSDLNNAADYVRSLTSTLRQELFTALVVLCLGAATIGFFLGIVYAHSR